MGLPRLRLVLFKGQFALYNGKKNLVRDAVLCWRLNIIIYIKKGHPAVVVIHGGTFCYVERGHVVGTSRATCLAWLGLALFQDYAALCTPATQHTPD